MYTLTLAHPCTHTNTHIPQRKRKHNKSLYPPTLPNVTAVLCLGMTDVKTQVNTREFHTTMEMRTEPGVSEAQWGHP